MLLTDDGVLQARIAEPKHDLAKVYWAQVAPIISCHAAATFSLCADGLIPSLSGAVYRWNSANRETV